MVRASLSILRRAAITGGVAAATVLFCGAAQARALAEFDPPPEKVPTPAPIVTEREVTIGGKALKYRATTGKLPLKDDAGKTKAEIFFIAYERTDVENAAGRPITFAFNGGPGSSSVVPAG